MMSRLAYGVCAVRHTGAYVVNVLGDTPPSGRGAGPCQRAVGHDSARPQFAG